MTSEKDEVRQLLGDFMNDCHGYNGYGCGHIARRLEGGGNEHSIGKVVEGITKEDGGTELSVDENLLDGG